MRHQGIEFGYAEAMKVLIADKFERVGVDGLKALGLEVVCEPDAGVDGIPAALEKHRPDVLVVRSTKVPAASVKAAGAVGVKVILRAGAGVDNIDVGTATGVGVAVCNCPGMNAVAVAELTFGLLLACDRRIVEQTIDARAGMWNKKEYSRTGMGKGGGAKGLKGMTLGVVGAGAIGRAVVKRAVAFEMHPVVWSRGITKEHCTDLGAGWGGTETPDLLTLAGLCDAVTIHLPLAADTKGLIGTAFLAAMRPGAIIINTSRGGIIDEAALCEAIAAKGLRAGLDVWENQPSPPTGPWASTTAANPGVVGTHHVGASTGQAQDAVAREVVRIIEVYRDTGRVENRVNG